MKELNVTLPDKIKNKKSFRFLHANSFFQKYHERITSLAVAEIPALPSTLYTVA